MFELATNSSVCVLFAQQPQAAPGGQSTFFFFAPLIIIGLFFYFLVLRPEHQRQRELKRMIGSLKKNDRVVTSGGIYGTVVNAQQDSEDILIKVDEATNTKLRILRSHVARVLGSDSSSESIKKESA
jgi:preprotein translocase subunit YajC